MSRRSRASAWASGVVLAGCAGLMALAESRWTPPEAPVARGEGDRPQTVPRRDGDEGGRRGGPGRRELSEEDVDRIIATARDIDPSWGDALEQVRGRDPAELRQRLGMQGRRLIGLAWLRDRQPELYRSRVDDFRAQRDVRRAIESIQRAREAGDAAGEASAMAEAREAIGRQVELDIKSRAHELVAMDRALKEARQRLQSDIEGRDRRVQELLDSAAKGEIPSFGRERDPMGPGPGPERGEPEGLRGPRPRGAGAAAKPRS